METTESPLDVLSRAAVMLQRNVLPPPSYGKFGNVWSPMLTVDAFKFSLYVLLIDEARSLSQQQSQKSKLPRKLKAVTNEVPIIDSTSTLSYDQIGNNLSIISNNSVSTSGKWKRERKHQQRTTAVASTCESALSDHKSNNKYSRRYVPV
jgi:hypothetical protein